MSEYTLPTLSDMFKAVYGPLITNMFDLETPEQRRTRILKKWNVRRVNRYLGVK